MLELRQTIYLYSINTPSGRIEEVNTSDGYAVLDYHSCLFYKSPLYYNLQMPYPMFFIKDGSILYLIEEKPNYYA
jgi:hypothetical protein